MRLDSHQHFWKFDPIRDAWIDKKMTILQRDFLPEHFAPLLKKHQFDGCIAVQADQSETETTFLLNLAKQHPFIKGVVGWVDLCAPNVASRITHFNQTPKFIGVRHIVQDEADDFLYRTDFRVGITALAKARLPYDLLIYPQQIPAAIDFVSAFPQLNIVLDHSAKPPIKTGEIATWESGISALSQAPNVYCKLSGFVTEANWNQWSSSQIHPYLDVVFDSFGTDRLLYGSDWPVSLLASTYSTQYNLINTYLSNFSTEVQANIMGLNAEKFYNLPR